MTKLFNESQIKGLTTELKCMEKFIEYGFIVSVPYGNNSRYDLLVDLGNGKYVRIQCKTASLNENGSYTIYTANSVATTAQRTIKHYDNAKDIHIHFPEGAVPKDGPSAGVTMVTALISALTDRAVRRDVAMTGEISLRGNVLAIGGLKEKTMAAYSAGVKTVLIPEENMRDLAKIDAMARDNLHFIPCRRASDVLQAALLPAKKAAN